MTHRWVIGKSDNDFFKRGSKKIIFLSFPIPKGRQRKKKKKKEEENKKHKQNNMKTSATLMLALSATITDAASLRSRGKHTTTHSSFFTLLIMSFA